jgi:predicted ATPase
VAIRSDTYTKLTLDGITRYDGHPSPHPIGVVRETLGRASIYALQSHQIAAATYSDEQVPLVARDGSNTAVVLAALKLDNDERFDLIEEAMRRIVPSVRGVQIKRAAVRMSLGTLQGNKIYFDTVGGTGIPAHNASHGTLVVLALLTILLAPGRPNLVMLDDLDHALHPRAQRELMHTLLRLLQLPEFADLQIIATTHSPYILDELEPSDVYAFALRDDGTVKARSLAEHPEAQKMSGVLTAGQLWSLDSERSWVLSD